MNKSQCEFMYANGDRCSNSAEFLVTEGEYDLTSVDMCKEHVADAFISDEAEPQWIVRKAAFIV